MSCACVAGLEYFIEIQHNTTKRMPPAYSCLLCDSHIRAKEARTDTLELALGHLKSLSHKKKFLNKHFQSIISKLCESNFKRNTRIVELVTGLPDETRKRILDVQLNGRINFLLQYLTRKHGFQKVKLVVGQKLFKSKRQEIKESIDNSTHFKEDAEAQEMWLGYSTLEKVEKQSKIDQYADAFDALERADKDAGKSIRSRSKSTDTDANTSVSCRRSLSPLSRREQSLDLPAPADQDEIIIVAERKSHSMSRERSRSRRRRSTRSKSTSPDNSSRSERQEIELTAREQRVVEFLKDREELFDFFDEEKKKYLQFPDRHPDYDEQWASFYSGKCRDYGTQSIQTEYINDEWMMEWRRYFSTAHERRIKEEINRLMHKHRLLRRDLDEFYDHHKELADRITRSGQTTNVTEKAGPAFEPARGQMPSASSPQKHEGSGPNSYHSKDVSQRATPPAGPSVIDTLKLLSALEHLLGDLGPKIVSAMGKSRLLEKDSEGSSESMIDSEAIFFLFRGARSRLTQKLESNGGIGDSVREICTKVNDNITLLLQRSIHFGKTEPIESQEREAKGHESVPDPTEIAVKAAIANSVAEQFRAAGKSIGGQELTRLVEEQYQRVKESLPGVLKSSEHRVDRESCSQERKTSSINRDVADPCTREKSRQESFPGSSKLDEASSSAAREEKDGRQQRSFPSVNNVDWDSVQSAVQRVSSDGRNYNNFTYPGASTLSRESRSSSHDRSQSSYNIRDNGSTPSQAEQSSTEYVSRHMPYANDSQPNPSRSVSSSSQGDSRSRFAETPRLPRAVVVSAGVTKDVPSDSERDGEYDFARLPVEELATLLTNFKDLEKDNQASLLEYMKHLESNNTAKVREVQSIVQNRRSQQRF